MFGYVRAYRPEMKFAEFDTYKAIYCTLCRKLGKSYGMFAQAALSYDFTFLLMLLLSVEDECCGYTKMRCRYNPLKKCMRLQRENEAVDFTAACLVIGAYYKLCDNIADSGFFKRTACRFLKLFYSRHRKKAARLYPEIDGYCAEMMKEQYALEAEQTDSLDRAAEPTAVFLQKVFAYRFENSADKRIMERLGYCAGKCVYLLDALDDLYDDLNDGGYNPLILKYSLKDGDDTTTAEDDTACLINTCITEIASAFELLTIKRYKSILANIIYLGMPDVLKKVRAHDKHKKTEDKIK